MFSPFFCPFFSLPKSLTDAKTLVCSFVLVICLISSSGCGTAPAVDNAYGKVNEKPLSINSTSLFAERLRELGYEVTVRNRISPKIDEFNTVFWFPEHTRCPSEPAIEAIEEWMGDGNYDYDSKTLVYVGADYRADEDYYQAIQKSVPPELKPEALRQLSEAQLATQNRKAEWDRSGLANASCKWFELEAIKPRKSNLLTGPLATDAGFSVAPELPIELMMSPTNVTSGDGETQYIGNSWRWEKETLLGVDGEDMIYRMIDRNEYAEDQVIVVQNASFLVNLAAVDPNKQALADQLIATACAPAQQGGYGFGFRPRVLILESKGNIPIRNTDFVNENSWAWIAEEPLCYIVPHALLWGVLFCFVYFPIFGRPQRLPVRSTTSFRNHINAVAKQLSRSDAEAHARETIKQYQESLTGSNKKNS